jgi:hypothetical protein
MANPYLTGTSTLARGFDLKEEGEMMKTKICPLKIIKGQTASSVYEVWWDAIQLLVFYGSTGRISAKLTY